jgi:fatty acid desaturase
MQLDQLTAQLLAELLGIGALGIAILWQPRHSCRWQHCPHHGKTVQEEIRLERERREREPGRSDPDR